MKKDISDEEIDQLAYHNIDLKVLKKLANPFNGCWIELEKPITIKEVKNCIAENKAELVITPSWYDIAFKKVELTQEEIRENHIKKIAFFAVNGMKEPISIDVGIPSLGSYVDHIVDDGNHRLAGAIVSGAKTIKAKVSGSVDHAKSMGLWNPNEYEIESEKRFMEKFGNTENTEKPEVKSIKPPRLKMN